MVNILEKMKIGETRVYSDPNRPEYDIEITRTSSETFEYRIITIVRTSPEFNSLKDAKIAAEKELSRI